MLGILLTSRLDWSTCIGSNVRSRAIRYSNGLQDSVVAVPRYSKGSVPIASFRRQLSFGIRLPMEHFSLTYNLNAFKGKLRSNVFFT